MVLTRFHAVSTFPAVLRSASFNLQFLAPSKATTCPGNVPVGKLVNRIASKQRIGLTSASGGGCRSAQGLLGSRKQALLQQQLLKQMDPASQVASDLALQASPPLTSQGDDSCPMDASSDPPAPPETNNVTDESTEPPDKRFCTEASTSVLRQPEDAKAPSDLPTGNQVRSDGKVPCRLNPAGLPSSAKDAQPASFKVAIKPKQNFNISQITTKSLLQTLSACLHPQSHNGYTFHRDTNSISVWVASLEAVHKLYSLTRIPVSQGVYLPVQAYLLGGTHVRRYVVSGVDAGETSDVLRDTIRCETHQVLLARYLGNRRTCLVTVLGPPEPPVRFIYNGCILRPRPYKTRPVFCYQCLQQGHMRPSCPNPPPAQAPANPNAGAGNGNAPKFRCGLCKSDDHDITDRKCPTKLNAKPRSRVKSSEFGQRLPLSNRYELLASNNDDNDIADHVPELVSATPSTNTASYSQVVRMRRRRQQSHLQENDQNSPALEEIDLRLKALQTELANLSARRTQLITQMRSKRTTAKENSREAIPSLSTSSVLPPPPVSSPAATSISSASDARSILNYVVQQLQILTTTLAACLR